MRVNDLCFKCKDFTEARPVKAKAELVPQKDNPNGVNTDYSCYLRAKYYFLTLQSSSPRKDRHGLSELSTARIHSDGLQMGEGGVFTLQPEDIDDEKAAEGEAEIMLHYGLAELRASAARGCHLCNIIQIGRWPWPRSSEDDKEDDKGADIAVPTLMEMDRRGSFVVELHYLHSGTWTVRAHKEFCIRLIEEPAVNAIPSAPRYGLREDTFGRIKDWMAECERHSDCRLKLSGGIGCAQPHPARLLEIVKDESRTRLCLRRTDNLPYDRRIPYAILSYRRGSTEPPARLLKANYSDYLVNIPINLLPRTFRDAVYVTSELGLAFLWIDALCIIQDSERDWQQEAPRMGPTYANCQVNLAATVPDNPEGGLLVQDYQKTQVEAHARWLDGSRVDKFIMGSAYYAGSIFSGALHRRAWLLQEQVLSPRIVHFASDQVWWECKEHRDKECKEVQTVVRQKWDSPGHKRNWRWGELVEHYTEVAPARQEDRLVAFAGIAEMFAHVSNGELTTSDYVAGLWRPRLEAGLLWHSRSLRPWRFSQSTDTAQEKDFDVINVFWQRKCHYDIVNKALEYNPPSWSWASTEGRVSLDDEPNVDRPKERVWSNHWKTISATVTTVTGDALSTVTGGELVMRSALHPFELREASEKPDEEELIFQEKYIKCEARMRHRLGIKPNSLGVREPCCEVHLDRREGSECSRDILGMLAIARVDIWRKTTLTTGIMLSPVEGQRGTYRRLGIVKLLSPNGPEYTSGELAMQWSTPSAVLDEALYLNVVQKGVYEYKVI